MSVDWNLFLSAVALAVVLEAIPYILAPDRMRALLRALGESEASSLRRYGLTILGFGLVLLFIVRRVMA